MMVAMMVDRWGPVLLAVAAIIEVDMRVPSHGNYWMEYGGCRFVLQRHRESLAYVRLSLAGRIWDNWLDKCVRS